LAYYLSEEFGREEKTIRTFARFILDDVYLVRIQTDSFATGLRIFETINARGRNLTPFDMVKNYLFAVVKPSESQDWGSSRQACRDGWRRRSVKALKAPA
jgi:uncharacterized protein with ParB-like and HNH nuclease domain